MKIDSFKNEYEFLSNFYPVRIVREGLTYASIEHAYTASKTYNADFKAMIAKIPAHQAGRAKRMGSANGMKKFRCTLKPNWDLLLKDKTMFELLLLKFAYPQLQDKLSSTNGHVLEEGNYWHDNYWGNCYCKKCANVKGENKLGQMIMEIRRTLK